MSLVIGARASGLGSPAQLLGALTRRALILRPPLRPESPPLSAQGHTGPSPPRELQATPSARRGTAGPGVSGGGRGVGKIEQIRQPDSHLSNRRAEKRLQSRPRTKMFKAFSVPWNFYWSKWRGKRNVFLVCFFGDTRPGQVQFLPHGLSDPS